MRSVRRFVFFFAVAAVALVRPARALDVPVTFTVENSNRSLVPCVSDGATYTVSGRLVGPDPVPASATLYLHGLGFGQFFWGNEIHDFAAAMAARGHASVIIDRLGYDGSGRPNGYLSCLGAEADVAAQIIRKLKSGIPTGTETVAFSKVALAGHSAGGATAQIAAYSFADDVDALAVLAYADQGASSLALSAFAGVAVTCATGGSPPGYASFGATDAEFRALMFSNPLPGADAYAMANRNPDPCGDDASIPAEIVVSNLLLGSIAKPVLLLCAESDAIFPPPACDDQRAHYGTDDFTSERVPGGHALTLETSVDQFETKLSNWLGARGF